MAKSATTTPKTTPKPAKKVAKPTIDDRIAAAVAAGLKQKPAATSVPHVAAETPKVEAPIAIPRQEPRQPLRSDPPAKSSNFPLYLSAAALAVAVLVAASLYPWGGGDTNTKRTNLNPPQGVGGNAPASAKTPAKAAATCSVPGSVWVEAVNGCVQHVTDVAEINKVTPADTADDPNCRGKPVGHRYDTSVTGPQGQQGVAHHVCGPRPKG